MRAEPVALSRARVLISNDDGIHAPGIALLERIMRRLAGDVWVVAPETEQSSASHSLTVRRPLRVRRSSDRRYAVDGTPTDSVLLAVHQILRDRPPDLVVSGINRGVNLGEDVHYSGTVAAAMEATLLGIRSIAFSMACDDTGPTRWATAERWVPRVVRRLAGRTWPANVLINVNVPDRPAAKVAGIEVCRMGHRGVGSELAERVDPRGQPYFWIGAQREEERAPRGTDLAALARGAVAVTPLCLDLTHRPTLKGLGEAFG